jgi:hypothetical protein
MRVHKITSQAGYDLLIRECSEIPLQITPVTFRATGIISKKHSVFCGLRKLLEFSTRTATGLEQKVVFIFTVRFARGFCEEQQLLRAEPFSDEWIMTVMMMIEL